MVDEFEQYAVEPQDEFAEYAVPTQSREAPQNLMQKVMRYGIQDPIAGLARGGRSTLNLLPKGIKSIEDLGNVLGQASQELPGPKPFTSRQEPVSEQAQALVDKLAPPDFDYSQALGLRDQPSGLDRTIQAAAEYAPELIGAYGLARGGLRALPPMTKRGATKKLQQAEKLYEADVPSLYGDREINRLLDKAPDYLDKTEATQRMLSEARGGRYEPLFSTQSQLGHESRALGKSPIRAESRIAGEPAEIQQNIVKRLQEHARAHGYEEAADLLGEGRKDYKQYLEFQKKVVPVLKKLRIPTSVVTALLGSYKVGKKLMSD